MKDPVPPVPRINISADRSGFHWVKISRPGTTEPLYKSWFLERAGFWDYKGLFSACLFAHHKKSPQGHNRVLALVKLSAIFPPPDKFVPFPMFIARGGSFPNKLLRERGGCGFVCLMPRPTQVISSTVLPHIVGQLLDLEIWSVQYQTFLKVLAADFHYFGTVRCSIPHPTDIPSIHPIHPPTHL